MNIWQILLKVVAAETERIQARDAKTDLIEHRVDEEDRGDSGLQGADYLLAHYFLADLMMSHIHLLRPHGL